MSQSSMQESVSAPLWHGLFVATVGLVSGAAAGMDALASADDPLAYSNRQIAVFIASGGVLLSAVMLLIRWFTVRLTARLDLDAAAQSTFLRRDLLSYLVGLVTLLGAVGVQFIGAVIAAVIIGWCAVKSLLLYSVLSAQQRKDAFSSLGYLSFLFLISGFAALIYQIVWERTLFAAFGVNIESITIIVSLFMFGLGIGSMLGGILSGRFPQSAPTLFLSCELGIGAFGIVSLPLINYVSTLTLHGSMLTVSAAIFGLLCIPTMLMGATLPILVNHLYRHYRNVGKSVGMLYFINTVGSAIACFVTADLLFVYTGQQGAVYVAAACNIAVGTLVSRYARRIARRSAASEVVAESQAAA